MPATKDHHNENNKNSSSSDNGKKIITTKPSPSSSSSEQGLKCPRCDSPNTKFCYYNNYSLTQPRHFCKTCRRYWTKGGALRNVPIGGGCRKNKQKGMKTSSSSSSSRALSYGGGDSIDSSGGNKNNNNNSSSDILQLGGLSKLLNGLSSNPLDFNLGGLTLPSSSSNLQQLPMATGFYNHNNNLFCSVSAASSYSSGGFQLDPSFSVVGGSSSSNLLGLNYFPFTFSSSSSGSGFVGGGGGGVIQQGMDSLNVNSTVASSIESLSSLNQDLHWKLQQQRLASMQFVGSENQNQKEDDNNNSINNSVLFSPFNNVNNSNNIGENNQTPVLQRPQPILFQSLEISSSSGKAALPSANNNNNAEIVGFPSTVVGGDSSCSRRDQGTNRGGDDAAATEWFFGNSYGSVAPTPTSTSSGGGGANGGNGGHDNNNAGSNNWGGGVLAWGDVQQQYSALP